MTLNVDLLAYTPEPLAVIYTAFQTGHRSESPAVIFREAIHAGDEKIMRYLDRRLAEPTHTTPLEHVTFTFAVSGLSRAAAAQLLRTRVGIAVQQQSQRYVRQEANVVIPPSAKAAQQESRYIMREADDEALYQQQIAEGVPEEDARYVLPIGQESTLTLTYNFQALLHLSDERLCKRSQWEIRQMTNLMKAALQPVAHGWFAERMGPQCMPWRLGYCPESKTAYAACPIGRHVPHRIDVIALHTDRKEAIRLISDATDS